MPRNRHTVEQIITKLREAEVALSKGQPVPQACRTLGITEQTYYIQAGPRPGAYRCGPNSRRSEGHCEEKTERDGERR
jgi:hypothetical protein